MPPPEKIRLGDLLARQALITQEQLASALAQQKTSGRKLGRILVDSGFVSEEQMDVEYELKTLSAQIEPMLIMFLGVLVLILALGVFLPVWDLGTAAFKH